MKIVIASDSFKGSLSSADVAASCTAGIHYVNSDFVTECVEVADGGEGTALILTSALCGGIVTCITEGPLGDIISASYGIALYQDRKTAILDTASAAGLTLVPENKRDIMKASTAGIGRIITDALEKGCERFIIGLGGSATCDGGIGMLGAIGCKFYDYRNNILPPLPSSLSEISRIDTTGISPELAACEFILLSDVSNPVCGPFGAACIFAPQKGALQEQVEILDRSLIHYCGVLSEYCGMDLSKLKGGGAAGGMPLAFVAVLHAKMEPGADKVLDIIGFENIIRDADLVITGEGKIDRQTLYGKLPYGVLKRCRKTGVPVVAIAGIVEDSYQLMDAGFSATFPITRDPRQYPECLDPEMTRRNIETLSASIARFFFDSKLCGL